MRSLLFFLSLSCICCQSPKQQEKSLLSNDTTIAAIDSVIRPAEHDYDPVQDSMNVIRERDSFYAIPPAAILTGHDEENSLIKLIATVVDTNSIAVREEVFKEDSHSTYDKDSVPVASEYIYKSRSYEVRLWHHNEDYKPGRIYINGKELRMERDIDTLLSGDWFIYHIMFSPEGFSILKFGGKEYLYLKGYVHNCNGSACGVSFYMLYDPTIKKAMVLQQFRAPELMKGYDKKTGSPVFIDMDDEDFNHRLDYYNLSGKMYRFDKAGKIRKLLNSKGEQFFFNAYTKREEPDTVFVKEHNFKK